MKPVWPILFCLLLSVFFKYEKSNATPISGIINSYHRATAIINYGTYNSYSYSGITLQDITGLSVGDRIMIIQMKGATISSANNSSFGNITDLGNAGKYEFSSICGFLNNTVVLSNHLLHTYDVSLLQVVRVPVYTDAEVTGTLTAQPWDATSGLGGVLALEVNGTLTLNAGINANGAGFKGGSLVSFSNCSFFTNSTAYIYAPASTLTSNANGAYKGEGLNVTVASFEGGRGKQANGGGGGNNHNSGGGGGSNYGAGGNGGNYTGTGSFPCNGTNAGIGAVALNGYGYSSLSKRIFLGGGGGSGHANNPEGTPGGDGGGIVYIKAAVVMGNGNSITANGTQGTNSSLSPNPLNEARGDGGGGGGAGGVLLLDVAAFTGTINMEASGAGGSTVGFQNSCTGPGGGGGGGVIWSSISLPGTVSTNVNGGISGIVRVSAVYDPPCEGSANNASAGGDGVVQTGFVAPQGTNTINCDILPINLLQQFTGKRTAQTIQLKWLLANTEAIKKLVLEKKTGNAGFYPLKEQIHPAVADGYFVDEKNAEPVTYRLLLLAENGSSQYSHHLFFDADKTQVFNLYPNPASENVTILLPPHTNGKTMITITDVNGRQLWQQEFFMQREQTTVVLSLKQLSAGMYQLRLTNNNRQFIAKLLKQ